MKKEIDLDFMVRTAVLTKDQMEFDWLIGMYQLGGWLSGKGILVVDGKLWERHEGGTCFEVLGTSGEFVHGIQDAAYYRKEGYDIIEFEGFRIFQRISLVELIRKIRTVGPVEKKVAVTVSGGSYRDALALRFGTSGETQLQVYSGYPKELIRDILDEKVAGIISIGMDLENSIKYCFASSPELGAEVYTEFVFPEIVQMGFPAEYDNILQEAKRMLNK